MRLSTLAALALVALGLGVGMIEIDMEKHGILQILFASDEPRGPRGGVREEDYPAPEQIARAARSGAGELHFIIDTRISYGRTVNRQDLKNFCLVIPATSPEACHPIALKYNRADCLAEFGQRRNAERVIVADMGDMGHRRAPSRGRHVRYAVGADSVLRISGCERQPWWPGVDWIPLSFDEYGLFGGLMIVLGSLIFGLLALLFGAALMVSLGAGVLAFVRGKSA